MLHAAAPIPRNEKVDQWEIAYQSDGQSRGRAVLSIVMTGLLQCSLNLPKGKGDFTLCYPWEPSASLLLLLPLCYFSQQPSPGSR